MIVKFNPQGRVVMLFGRKKQASDEDEGPWTHVTPPRPAIDGQFRQPADITWDREGNIFISDEYINQPTCSARLRRPPPRIGRASTRQFPLLRRA